ncbi:MAG: acetolactate synthase large subunit [Pseudomonadales bacterium]
MNGAEALLKTLVDSGIDVCFANPGTSEMQLVSAIGKTDRMRAILCLFEGVVSGAADGYARMADKPALTLLHVGSGFSNSMANLHNAKRAHVPLLNIVGDHATYHLQYDAPLTTDVSGHAKLSSHWVKVSSSADDLPACGAQAVAAACQGSGKIATLIVPANHAWEETTAVAPSSPVLGPELVTNDVIDDVVEALGNAKSTALFLGGRALRAENLALLGAIAHSTGVRLLCETFPARLQRGADRVAVERLPYFAEQAAEFLGGFEQLILIGAKAPVAFFAYPGKESWLAPQGCDIKTLANTDQDIAVALQTIAAAVEADPLIDQAVFDHARGVPEGVLTPMAIGESVTALLPSGAIVSDEGATCGLAIYSATQNAAAHDWLTLTGGAIGQGLPVSLGAAIACPDRKVVALQADGSAMYTVQALWTMARESTDITIVLLNNRSYAILNIELARVGAGEPNAKTLSMLDLSNPNISWVDIAQGMGVPATLATRAEEFHQQFAAAMASKGPRLIEAVVTQ